MNNDLVTANEIKKLSDKLDKLIEAIKDERMR